ncbi:MAG: PAS domain S-box protein [Candidatus Acidiferrales bacterium]
MSQPGPGLSVQPDVGGDNYRLLFDWNPQPMWVWDDESLRFLAANEAAVRRYGYSQDEFLAVNIEGVRPATEAQSLSKFLSKSLTDIGHAAVCKFQRKDGTPIDVEIHSQPINWASKPAHLVVMNDITDRERTEHALRDSEERVRLILASAAEAIFGCDSVGTCIFCNHSAALVLGYNDPAELVGKNMHQTEHHTRADGTPYPLEECPIYLGLQKAVGVHRDDEIFWRRDGSSFPVEYWSHLMMQGGRTLCVVAFMDITARKQAEEALRKSEELKTRLIASSHDCIKVLDIEGRLLSMNEGGMEALEICDVGPLVNSSWIDFWEGDDREAARDAVEVASTGGTGHFVGYFATRVTKQPKWWDVVVSPIRGPKGEPEQLVAVSRDITEHRQNEEALREANRQVTRSEERWRAVFENSAIGVALTDLNGRFLAVNRAYEKMLGYTEEELRKLTFLEITAEDHRGFNWELVNDLLEGKRQQFQIEKQYRCKDGSLRWVSNNVSLVPGTERMPRFIMALSEDVTERKQAEAALRKSEERSGSLLRINNAIITNLTQRALLHSISEALRSLISFDRCAITLYKPERDAFHFLAVEGDMHSDYFRAGLEVSRNETCAGWVFDRQRPLVRRDLEQEAQYANERRLVTEGIRSMCVFPLVVQGRCIGTLSLVSRERDRYSGEDAAFLQEVANQVALAIENLKSYGEISELKARLEKENVYLREELRKEHNFEEIVGDSPALLATLRKVEQVAPTDSTVLIYGETGTGKELVARAIHNRSVRKDRPLVKVNCSAISAGLVESELFGHVKGAFTGAIDRRIGRFELADGGTIFLDEIGELPLETQVKLLRVLQEREFEPVGSSRPLRVDVRVIAATNRDLQESIQSGRFRADLFYRLNVFPMEVPPLRERRSDIPKLTKFFLSNYSKKLGKTIEGISQATMDRILGYSWPGNIRELQNIIERAVVLSQGHILELQQELALSPFPRSDQGTADKPTEVAHEARLPALQLPTLKEVERRHIVAALKLTSGVIEGPKGAAKILNLHPNTLRHRMEKFGIKRSAHDPS